MTDGELEERLTNLADDIEHIRDVSTQVLLNNVAWLTSNQTILAVLLNHVLRESDDPAVLLDKLEFEARSIIRNRTNFNDNSKESADIYREKAEEKIVQFFRDISLET